MYMPTWKWTNELSGNKYLNAHIDISICVFLRNCLSKNVTYWCWSNIFFTKTFNRKTYDCIISGNLTQNLKKNDLSNARLCYSWEPFSSMVTEISFLPDKKCSLNHTWNVTLMSFHFFRPPILLSETKNSWEYLLELVDNYCWLRFTWKNIHTSHWNWNYDIIKKSLELN